VTRGAFRFQLHERLRSSAEYQQVKRCGKRLRARHFGVNVAVNGLPHHRLGLVVQKRFWGAVKRNRIKRCLREWFRLNKSLIALPGKDIVIVAHPGAERLSSIDTAKELNAALTVAG
jgi:ribonuclease P protein component